MSISRARKRPRRADAVRNRAAILDATEELLGTDGPAMSTEEVARRAGVGIATVFRHFPTKAQLLQAVVALRIERLTRQARRLLGTGDEALFRFFEVVLEHTASTQAIRHALASAGVDPDAAVEDARAEFVQVLGTLLAQAQTQGVVRSDVDVADVYDLLVAVVQLAQLRGREGRGVRIALTVVFDGLRARSSAGVAAAEA